MLGYFLKNSTMKKILQLQDRSWFIIKNTKKTTTLQQVTGGETPNLVLEKLLKLFVKIPPPKKTLKLENWKKTAKLIQKRKLQVRIKPMIENVKDELYQLESKQVKSGKVRANIR